MYSSIRQELGFISDPFSAHAESKENGVITAFMVDRKVRHFIMFFLGLGLVIIDRTVDIKEDCFGGFSTQDWVLFTGVSLLAWFPCILLSLVVLAIPAYTLEFARVDPRFSRVLHAPTTTFMWAALLPFIRIWVRYDDEMCRGDSDELLNVILMFLTFTGLAFCQHMLLRSISYSYYSQSLSRMQTMLEADTIMTSLLSYLRRGDVSAESFLHSQITPTKKNVLQRVLAMGRSKSRSQVESENLKTPLMDVNSVNLTDQSTAPDFKRSSSYSLNEAIGRTEDKSGSDTSENIEAEQKEEEISIKKLAFANARNFMLHLRKKANRIVNGRAIRFSSSSISAVAEEIGTEIYDGLIERRGDEESTEYNKEYGRPLTVEENNEEKSGEVSSRSSRRSSMDKAARLTWEDFRRPFAEGSNGTEDEADQFASSCLSLFDDIGDRDTTVSKSQLVSVLTGILTGRNALVVNSFDSQHALAHLESILFMLVVFISCFIWLIIWDVDLNKLFITFSTVVLAFAFFFGATAKEFFEGVIFVFIRHPYDVGDKIGIEGDKYIVEEIQLLSTVLKHWSGTIVYMPHNRLNNLPIQNVYRSGPMMHDIGFYVNGDTSEEKMDLLEDKLKEFFEEKMSKQIDSVDWTLTYYRMDEMNRLLCQIWIDQKTNFMNGERLHRNRTRIFKALRRAMKEIGITFALPVQPVQLQQKSGGDGADFDFQYGGVKASDAPKHM